MEIIVTHDNSDFDALSSMVAASHLYPGAKMVLGRRVAKPVRDYLALHKDRFPTLRFDEFDHDEVTRWIVVDVRRADRLSDYARLVERAQAGELETHVYDHHGATPQDLLGDVDVVEPVGAATTLLIERLRAAGAELDPEEATLMALGIQADTGGLTYARTTARDAEAYAWTLAQGARLAVVNRYLNTAFDDGQRAVLARMLGHVREVEIGPVKIGTLIVPLERSVPDLGALVTQVAELEGHAGLLAVFPTNGKRSFVVGRATVPFFDVHVALAAVGGGGHGGAAAAMVKHADGEAILEQMLAALRADPPQPREVGDVMTSPARTIDADRPLEEAARILMQENIRGMPVLRDGALVGVISRRDLEKARRDDRMHLRVSSCMAHHPKVIEPSAPLEQALSRMSEADVGRLPVLRQGHLVGIVSRADILRVLYGEGRAPPGSLEAPDGAGEGAG